MRLQSVCYINGARALQLATVSLVIAHVCEGDMAVNAPVSEGAARGRGGVYSHITKATCANYYITSHLIGPHDVAMNTA